MRRIQNVFIAAIIVAALGSTVIAQENYSQWSYFRNLALNTKASGANVATTVTNFPVLIRLTAADSAVFSTALANGADVRFAKANGTHLKYQIEQWNSATKTAAIWVLVDTVKGNEPA